MNPKLALWLSWVAFGSAVIGYAIAQGTAQAPNLIPGCVTNSTPLTATAGQVVPLQCDLAGKLRVNTT